MRSALVAVEQCNDFGSGGNGMFVGTLLPDCFSNGNRLYLKNGNGEYQRNIIAGNEYAVSCLLLGCARLY
jgi:hypothetical protein